MQAQQLISSVRPVSLSTDVRSRGFPGFERRTVRADGACDAMETALDWAISRGGLTAIVLADADGLMVCSSRSAADLSLVAAVLPLLARGDTSLRFRAEGCRQGLSMATITLSGETVFVAALGGEASSRRRELATACRAARRILG